MILFEFTYNEIELMVNQFEDGQKWLCKKCKTSQKWIFVKKLTDQEVENYQKMAGIYPRLENAN